ncbi:OmpA family protein [Rivihabitans pingtungensis]|uniref:OmpA family protein n=1 Tax=Rivihabitans pingtungensis TaxID=1054498 RepID=UPI00235333EF|nr:OmpA family protein [Rivihabitans pingtungensis]MCK6437676.1 OmpA family protein [Rivihabitans pingtungensis]
MMAATCTPSRLLGAILLAWSTLNAPLAHADDGKRRDNARLDEQALPVPGERQPLAPYPLPSGVSRADWAAWRAASPPAAAPLRELALDDASGALFVSGRAELTPAARRALDLLLARHAGQPGLRLAVVGHTDNQGLSARARQQFADNQALSEARALSVAQYLRQGWQLAAEQVSIAGQGARAPRASNASAAGMARNRRVDIRLWAATDAPLAAVTPPRPACAAQAEQPDLPFRVTVDGEPLVLGQPVNEADRQRCTDVALEQADIQIKYDDLAATPSLNVWTLRDLALRGQPVAFAAYSNYVRWIQRAELRVFKRGQRPDERPLAVAPLDWAKGGEWTPPAEGQDEYAYLLRVYDRDGRFDETALKALNLASRARPLADLQAPAREVLAGWGENARALGHIPVTGGTVSVSGQLRPGQRVMALGLSAPVDGQGRFVLRQILPAGPHQLDVIVSEPDGREAMFRRNVSIPDQDWFYIAVGDLTLSQSQVSGPAQLVSGDSEATSGGHLDGRAAFYLKGKIKGDWLLTAAADTREQPVKNLFSNFTAKDPRYLLRNIDPNQYYPVYGDDSSTVDDAPTQGKFFVRLARGDSQVMWGNFQTQWAGSELIQYSRGLYGALARWRSEDATPFGERRSQLEAFAADPGTLGAREEFRGTGGSLYYLRHQDITQGSERVWVEVRDPDSGLVLERRQLTAGADYEVNYLQGRILLREPLPSTASGGGLVYTSSLSGRPLYLVSSYEYVPGLSEIGNQTVGLRATHWLNDLLQLGITQYRQGENASQQTLRGLDATLRLSAGSQLRAEFARASGPGTTSFYSQDGGFGFNAQASSVIRDASARRLEARLDLADWIDGGQGQFTGYWQQRERGFAAPGQVFGNGEAVRQFGVQGSMALSEASELRVKADSRVADTQTQRNVEVGVATQLDTQWKLSGALRHDRRDNAVANASPTLSQNGARTDAIVRADYTPPKEDGTPGQTEDWSAYGFVQATLARSGEREANHRAGLGGRLRLNDRAGLNAEASDGSLGVGGKLGVDYRISDRSTAYLDYRLESDNPEHSYRGRSGAWVSGADYRVSEQMRLFGETRAVHGAGPQSLTQAFGVDLAPNDRWTLGVKTEAGTLSDMQGGDLKRLALGFSAAYKFEQLSYAGALELRNEHGNSAGIRTQRQVWLLRNSLGYQLDPAWRLLGKLNLSRSSNSQGAFYDGNFHEVVLGAAYRPVDNDRWNTLFKYTNLYNAPTAGQLAPSGVGSADYAQRSQVFSVDTVWDVWPRLSLGAKYGLRIGELRANKTSGEWFSSRADLLVLRADWHVVKEWDALAEWRTLRAKEAQDARAGLLLGVYRHLDKHVKIGVGYNFTRYADDLTDLSYRNRGWFLNVLGTL